MKINVKRVISKFKLEVSETAEEYLQSIFKNLLFDLKLINMQKHIKLSRTIQFKGAIIRVKIEEATRLTESYNKSLMSFWEDYKNIWERWHGIEIKDTLKKVIDDFQEKFNREYEAIVSKSETLINDIALLRAHYVLQKTEDVKVNKIEKKLKELSETTYKNFIASIKQGNLPLI